MLPLFLKKEKDNTTLININIILLNCCVLLFIIRTAFPFFKYLFVGIYVPVLIFLSFKYSQKISIVSKTIFKRFFLAIIMFFILILAFSFSNKLYLLIIKNIINIIFLLSFFYAYGLVISSKRELSFFKHNFIFQVIVFAFIISVVGILEFVLNINLTHGLDYNFALIPVLFGLISVFYQLLREKDSLSKLILYSLLFVFTTHIILSGSRRGLFFLLLIILAAVFIQIFGLFKKIKISKKLLVISRNYLLPFIFLFITFSFIFYFANYNIKSYMIERINPENPFLIKRKVTDKVFRYIKFIDNEISYDELLDKLWSHDYNPYDPRSGWARRRHVIKYPLVGENVEIVPKGARGYLMDSTCNANSWNNNAYSFTEFANIKINSEVTIKASVYCYVSESFNGTWVVIKSEGDSCKHRVGWYDLKKKGVWQKLELEVNCDKGDVPIYLYFAKDNATNFNDLKGYVIYAYPTYKILDNNDSIIYDASKGFSQLLLDKNLEFEQTDFSITKASILPLLSPTFIFNSNKTANDITPEKKIINEDTTYYGYETNIDVNYDPRRPINGRIARWTFTWKLYQKEYNWKQKIIGNGFNYLNWYGNYFLNDKTKSDYPHNPFLSVLLYSGMIGLVFYLYLILKVVRVYLKYIKEYYILFIFFCITFFFSFFSANTPFSPPIMGFFVLLPFFIDYIHKKDKSI